MCDTVQAKQCVCLWGGPAAERGANKGQGTGEEGVSSLLACLHVGKPRSSSASRLNVTRAGKIVWSALERGRAARRRVLAHP